MKTITRIIAITVIGFGMFGTTSIAQASTHSIVIKESPTLSIINLNTRIAVPGLHSAPLYSDKLITVASIQTRKTTRHIFTISGSSRSTGNSTCTWTDQTNGFNWSSQAFSAAFVYVDGKLFAEQPKLKYVYLTAGTHTISLIYTNLGCPGTISGSRNITFTNRYLRVQDIGKF
jgi:hypothetical protein